jgi:uncharacterized protein (UPF0335 family)
MTVTRGALLHELVRRVEQLEQEMAELRKQAPRKAAAKPAEK